ncbi:MAG: hypothetical protein LBT44_00760, partial [Clostridiales bacterium]|nr:hypothetical protein [Clostridiales bacterium]
KSAAQQESNVPDNGESPKKEETDTMKIDKSKMTAEELTALADFEKRYGAEDEPVAATGAATPPDEIIKDTAPSGGHVELHPEVKKALAELDAIKKANEELTKSLEMERLTAIAKKYEVIGKKTDELAPKLYGLKKAGGTVYADYVALLDENVATVEKSGLFGAIGSDASGTADTVDKIGIAAKEITKSANVGNAAAIVKAWEDNPELAAAYEKEYLGGVN